MSKRGRRSFARNIACGEASADVSCRELAAYNCRTDAGADVVVPATYTTNRTNDLMLKFNRTRKDRGRRSKGDHHGFLVAG
jgi:hypothetical protein